MCLASSTGSEIYEGGNLNGYPTLRVHVWVIISLKRANALTKRKKSCILHIKLEGAYKFIHAIFSLLCSQNPDVDVDGKFSKHPASFQFPLRIEETHIAIIVAEPNFFGSPLKIQ